ncbi:MAG TPA: hypothetical protein VGQ46_23380 [Thermoanaerobaculia bacterium]|nr:hypothetical protein [Thermoanaerobaculia bacterium]
MIDQRAGDGYALLHAAAEVFREVVGEFVEADGFQIFVGELASFVVWNGSQPEAVLDVLADGQPAEGGVGLEDHAAVAADPFDRLPFHEHFAARRREESGDRLEDRRFFRIPIVRGRRRSRRCRVLSMMSRLTSRTASVARPWRSM